MSSSPTLDPVCGRPVDPLRARAVGIFGGTTYYFCSFDCKARYADPRGAPAHVEVNSRSGGAPSDPEEQALLVERRAPDPVERIAPGTGDAPDEPRVPSKRSAIPLVLGAVVVVGIGAVFAWRQKHRSPVMDPPSIVAPPPHVVQPPAVSPPPPILPPPPVVPTYPELVAPLKLGMRRFLGGDPPIASVQLLVIDANDQATPIRIAELPGADPSGTVTSDAVTPEPAFQNMTSAQGAIFSTRLVAGDATLDVRVVRLADAIVAETSTTAGAWHAAARIPLLADAQLRAAAFAKKRYVTEEKP